MAGEKTSSYTDILKAFLESLIMGGAYSRYRIAKKLKACLSVEKSVEQRRILEVEIFVKQMQLIEDLVATLMMWEDPKSNPLDKYVKTYNRDIKKFLHRASKGLSDGEIMSIYGLQPPDALYTRKAIGFYERERFEEALKIGIPIIRDNLKRLGKLYTKPDDAKSVEFSGIVHAYFNAKHGPKMLRYSKHGRRLGATKTNVCLYEERVLDETQSIYRLHWGGWNLGDPKMMNKILKNMRAYSSELKEFANLRLRLIDDPDWAIKRYRKNGYI